MRGVVLLLISFFLFSLAAVALAQETEIPDPGLTPDSFFYFLERISEGIGTFFTFGDVAKAERYAELAAERVAEAKAVIEKGKPEAAEKALAIYQDQLEKSLAKVDQAQAKGKSVSEVAEVVAQATAKHLTVLEEVLEKIPEQAKPAILQAREVSVTGQAKALENLANEEPEKAASLNIQAIQNRLEKVRNEAAERDEENIERTLADFAVLRSSLEKIGKEKKMVLASLVSETMTEQIEDLDELEDEIKNVSSQMAKKVQAVKASAINGQIDVLRNLASVDPEKAAEIFSKAAEKRLALAKQEAEDGDTEELEEAIEEFEKYALFGQEISEIAQGIGKDVTTVEQLVARASAQHLEVLNDVYDKVPAEAKEAIQKAMTVSEVGRQNAVESLKEKGALENIPETVPVLWEVKQRVIEERKAPKPGTQESEETQEAEEVEKPEPKPKLESIKPQIEKPEAGEELEKESEEIEIEEQESSELPGTSKIPEMPKTPHP